jgi:hypothetical protein
MRFENLLSVGLALQCALVQGCASLIQPSTAAVALNAQGSIRPTRDIHDWGNVLSVKRGARVRVKLATDVHVEGRFSHAVWFGIDLATPTETKRLQRSDVQWIEQEVRMRADPSSDNVVRGAALGAGAGAAAALVVLTQGGGGDPLVPATALVLIGAGIGALVGAAGEAVPVWATTWTVVYAAPPL